MSNTVIIYCILNIIILFSVSKISYRLNLVDLPDKRKIHKNETAFTGGIAISIILLFAIILFDNFNKSLSVIISISFLISVVGFIDDKYNLNTGGKLSLQVIPIFYLIIYEGLLLNQIGNYNYFYLDLGVFSVPFTLLSLLFLINAFNYFDGVDGVLGFSSISVCLILMFLAFENSSHSLVQEKQIQFFLFVILLPIIFFLFFNFSFLNLPKLFLGDSGSLLLGFLVSFILIYFANQGLTHPILLAWSVAIFVYEFLSINIIRIIRGRMIFKAGQDHLHHILLNKTKSIFLTNIIISASNFLLFAIGYFSYVLINELASLIVFIITFIIFYVLRNFHSIKYKN